MIALLMTAELKNSAGDTPAFAGLLDGTGITVGGAATTSTAYLGMISTPDLAGGPWTAGGLAVFPATTTSHTIAMSYKCGAAGTASFKNRRIWAWVL